jgi:hypothetical protein
MWIERAKVWESTITAERASRSESTKTKERAMSTEGTRKAERARVTGPIEFMNQLLVTWRLEPEMAYTLLGFESADCVYVCNVLRGFAILRGRDAKDRISYLFEIRSSLWALFQDEAVENEWLREPQEVLGGKTPIDLLQEGSMENLLLVKECVELAAGR